MDVYDGESVHWFADEAPLVPAISPGHSERNSPQLKTAAPLKPTFREVEDASRTVQMYKRFITSYYSASFFQVFVFESSLF